MTSREDVEEITFVEEPLDINYECLVCLQLLREPWIVECCGHHLCKPCINKIIRDKKGCPHCRTAKFRHMRDRNHQRILLGKRVYCKYKSKGCKWQGTLREVDQHSSARFNCEWCWEPLHCYEEEQHQYVCAVAVEMIECELKEFGCSEKFPRMNMQQHMQDHCKEHIKLMKQAYKQSSSKVSLLTDKVYLLEKEGLQFRTEKELELKEMRVSCGLLTNKCSLLTKKVDLLEKETVQKEITLEKEKASSHSLTKKVDLAT